MKNLVFALIVFGSSTAFADCAYKIFFQLSDNVRYQRAQCVDEIKVTPIDDYRYRVSFQDHFPLTKIPFHRIQFFLNGDWEHFTFVHDLFKEVDEAIIQAGKGHIFYSYKTGFVYVDNGLNKINSDDVQNLLQAINGYLM